LTDALEFGFRCGLGNEVIHSRLGRDSRGGLGIVACDHDRLDAHLPQVGKALLDPTFDYIFEVDDSQDLISLRDDQRRPTEAGYLVYGLVNRLRKVSIQASNVRLHRAGCAFANTSV